MGESSLRYRVHLFGGFRVVGREQEWKSFETQRSAKLLALLVLSSTSRLSRQQVGSMLWPDEFPDAIRLRLRQELSRLRRALGEASVVIESNNEFISFEKSEADSDIELLQSCTKLQRDARGYLHKLQEAFDACRGDFLGEWDDPWVLAERRTYLASKVLVSAYLGEKLVEMDEPQAAIDCVSQVVDLDPTHERLRMVLIKAKAMLGSLTSALAEFQDYKHKIAEQSGRNVPVEAEELIRDISQGTFTPSPSKAPQAVGTVPSTIDPFIGRRAELDQIGALFCSGSRLVTVVGPGGLGKTRISLEFARLAQDEGRFASFVSLEHVSEASKVLPDVISQLGLHASEDSEPAGFLSKALPQNAVLIFDNLEQIPDAGSPIADLLSRRPDISILVTSRRPMAVQGEIVYQLGPLEPETDGLLLLKSNLGVQATKGFQEDCLREIAVRLDGMPLALHLAIGRLRLMSPSELVKRLDAGDFEFQGKKIGLVGKHESIRKSLEWSLRGLSDDVKLGLTKLACLPGSWNVGFAKAVLQVDDDVEVIEKLCDSGLLLMDDDSSHVRFRILLPIRQVILEGMDPALKEQIYRLASGYLTELISTLVPSPYSPLSREEVQILDDERTNFEWALSMVSADTLEIARRFSPFLTFRGRAKEGRQLAEAFLSVSSDPAALGDLYYCLAAAFSARSEDQNAEDAYSQAILHYVRSGNREGELVCLALRPTMQRRNKGLNVAFDAVESLRETFSQCDYPIAKFRYYYSLGQILLYLNRHEESADAFRKSYEYACETGDDSGRANAGQMMMYSSVHQGDLQIPTEVRNEVNRLIETFVDPKRIAFHHELLGRIAYSEGRLSASEREFRNSLELWDRLENRYQCTDQRHSLCRTLIDMDRLAEARDLLLEAAEGWKAENDLGGLCASLTLAARLQYENGDVERAREILGFTKRFEAQHELALVDIELQYREKLATLVGGALDSDIEPTLKKAMSYFYN